MLVLFMFAAQAALPQVVRPWLPVPASSEVRGPGNYLVDTVSQHRAWKLTELDQLHDAVRERGVALDRAELERVARSLNPDADLAENTERVIFLVPLLVLVAKGALGGLLVQGAECLGTAIFSEGQSCDCEEFVKSAAIGAVVGPVFGAVRYGGITAARAAKFELGEELQGAAVGQAVDVLATQIQGSGDSFGSGVCDFFRPAPTAYDPWVGDMVTQVNGQYDGFSGMQAAFAGNPVFGASAPLTTFTSVSGGFQIEFRDIDQIRLESTFIPYRTGAFDVKFFASEASTDFPLGEVNVVIDSSSVDVAQEVSLDIGAQTLLDLTPGDNEFFVVGSAVLEVSPSLLVQPPPQLFDSLGLFVRPAGTLNRAPNLTHLVQTSAGAIQVKGTYFDADNDAAQVLYFKVGSTQYELPTTGSANEGSAFNHQIPLADGVYSVRFGYSDGIEPVVETPVKSVRVNSQPVQVGVALDSSSINLDGGSVGFTVSATDGAGPIPGAVIRISTDGRGLVRDATSEPTFLLTTGANGQAQGSYDPATPGNQTILGQHLLSKRFAYASLDVTGGSPSDWTTSWTWSVISNSEQSATYECQILIQFQGRNLDPSDDVFFSSNHGSFQRSMDEVLNDGYIYNEFTLTKAEAEAGQEIFTLTIPEYDVELVHTEDLLVGSPEPLAHSRSTTVASNDAEDYGFGVAVSDDGRYLASGEGRKVKIRRLTDLSVVRTVDPDWDDINVLDFSPDGNKIIAGDDDGRLHMIDVDTGAYSSRALTGDTAAILALDWYQSDRVVVGTAGHTTHSYTPRAFILNASLNTVAGPVYMKSSSHRDDIQRVTCSPAGNLCAMTASMRDPTREEWAWFTPAGAWLGSEQQGDANPIFTVRFNASGTRLFVGAYDFEGIAWRRLYSVSGTSISRIADPITANRHIYASSFVVDSAGQERLAIGGNSRLELFGESGGAVIADVVDPNGTDEESYHLEFLPSSKLLVVINNDAQHFYNLSGDNLGPGISCSTPPQVGYDEDQASVYCHVSDPSGVAESEYDYLGSTAVPVDLDGSGGFSVHLSGVPVGDSTFVARASDLYGNTSSQNVTITRRDDLEPPLIGSADVAPVSGSPGTNFLIAASVQDLLSPVAGVTATLHRLDGTLVAVVALLESGTDLWSGNWDSTGFEGGETLAVNLRAVDASPSQNVRTLNGASTLFVTSARIFEDGFETGNILSWSNNSP